MHTTQQQQQQQMPMIVSATTTAKPATAHTAAVVFGTVKDSRWLTLEVCREFARNKCIRSDDECRFAHPTSNVEVQNGRVMCCFDSIKGRCQRSDPPCKYLHPPQHLKEQLLQNGRNNLMWRNFQMQQLSSGIHQFVPTMFPVVHQGPSAPPPSHPLPPPPPSASYLISTNTAPHPPPVTYYHSPLPSSTTTNESPLVSMTTVAMMTRSMTSQPATHCNIVQSDVAESVPDTSATCLPNNGGGCQNQYWLNQQPSAFFDSSSACANYYSPPTAAVFYQGLNQLVPVAKTHLIPADLRNGNVTVFPCGSSASSYQQMTLPSVITGGGVGVGIGGGVGGQQQPCYGRLAVPGTIPVMQRY